MPTQQPIRGLKRHEIAARLMKDHPDWKQQYAHYMAGKLQRLIQHRDLGWYAALRVLGIHDDHTARTALRATA